MGRVGIFWFNRHLEDFFITLVYDFSQGVVYGSWIISPEDHATYWDSHLEEAPILHLNSSARESYYYLPRGRVSYNQDTEKFHIYHGSYLNKKTKDLIITKYNLLKREAVFEYDMHYDYG